MGGSSGGARPKILTEINGKDWIIKFPAHIDSKDIGYQEYLYLFFHLFCLARCKIIRYHLITTKQGGQNNEKQNNYQQRK